MHDGLDLTTSTFTALAGEIKRWGLELGFSAVGITDIDLAQAEPGLLAWLDAGLHGEMDYLARHGLARARPAALVPGTVRVICARMDYSDPSSAATEAILQAPHKAFVSRYALGRDYHKVLRQRLQSLATRISEALPGLALQAQSPEEAHQYRVFTDSAPVLEVELATKAGLGWRGKHTLLLAREAGSQFFLGEIFTNLPLPIDTPVTDHCGACRACIDVCPTQAITAPYRVDARRCISYLTIELKTAIPLAFRPLIGNRVYGCDDCQLTCPWNKFAQAAPLPDFKVRNGLDDVELVTLFAWSEAQFNERLAGSAIRRIGHERWLRNLAVGLGNALRELTTNTPRTAPDKHLQAIDEIRASLRARADDASALVREHVAWALEQGD